MNNQTNLLPLSKEEIENKIETLDDWCYRDGIITKLFNFKDFSDALNFVKQLEPILNNIDHHPDIHIFYNKIIFDLFTHSLGKITDKDFMAAEIIEKEYKKYKNI